MGKALVSRNRCAEDFQKFGFQRSIRLLERAVGVERRADQVGGASASESTSLHLWVQQVTYHAVPGFRELDTLLGGPSRLPAEKWVRFPE